MAPPRNASAGISDDLLKAFLKRTESPSDREASALRMIDEYAKRVSDLLAMNGRLEQEKSEAYARANVISAEKDALMRELGQLRLMHDAGIERQSMQELARAQMAHRAARDKQLLGLLAGVVPHLAGAFPAADAPPTAPAEPAVSEDAELASDLRALLGALSPDLVRSVLARSSGIVLRGLYDVIRRLDTDTRKALLQTVPEEPLGRLLTRLRPFHTQETQAS